MLILNFDNLVTRFGEAAAWQYLVEIEKASGIYLSQIWETDPEIRLLNAVRVQDAMSQSEMQIAA